MQSLYSPTYSTTSCKERNMIETAVSTFLGGFIQGGALAVMVCHRSFNGHIHSPGQTR